MRVGALIGAAALLGLLAWWGLGSETPRGERGRVAEPVAPERRVDPATDGPAAPEPASAPVRRAVGTVNAPAGHVEIWLDRGSDRRLLAREPFADGSFALALPAFTALEKISGGLVARAEAEGFRPGASERVALNGAPDEVRLDLELEEGAVVTGRVVDEAGRPAADAEVWLSPNALDVSAPVRRDGRFALPIDRAAECWLCARAGATGVAVRGPLQLSPRASFEAGDLVLRGPGTLEGVAVYPDGTPVRRMDLHAVPAARREDTITSFPGPRFDAATDAEAARGLRWGWTTTGEDGRFALRGLRTGQYFFLQDKGRALFTTGSNARVVIDRRRILVEIVDGRGEPVPVGLGVSARSSRGARAAGQIDDLTAAPGVTWTIAIGSLDLQPAHATIEVTEERYEYVARLVARPVTERGRLRVRALDPRGEPIEGVRLTLYTVPSGDVILYRRPVGADGRPPALPPGRYRLVATPGGDPFALYFPAEAEEVDVTAGADVEVTVRARAAGRARFVFRVAGRDGTEPIGRPRIRATPQQGGEPRYLGAALRPRAGGGYSLGGAWNLNEPTLASRLLEPGPYDLEIDVDGYAPVRLPLSVRPGEVADVEVPLAK